MTRRRWIADEVSGNHAAVTGAHAAHLATVLRARLGQEFDIATGTSVRRGKITSIRPDKVEFELGEEIAVPASSEVTLVLAIFKFDRMEWAIEKCTELGVARIVPVIAQRTESHLAVAASKRAERWRRIARQASEQSRRNSQPVISPPVKLKDAVTLEAGTRLVLAETERNSLLKTALASHRTEDSVVLALGPEGGWTDAELEMFTAAGWTAVSLGDTVLRAETAAIAALVVTLSEMHR